MTTLPDAQRWNPDGRPGDKTRIPGDVFRAALDAAFPGLPEYMTLEEAERRVAAALNDVWPRIERRLREQVAREILSELQLPGPLSQ